MKDGRDWLITWTWVRSNGTVEDLPNHSIRSVGQCHRCVTAMAAGLAKDYADANGGNTHTPSVRAVIDGDTWSLLLETAGCRARNGCAEALAYGASLKGRRRAVKRD